MRATTAPTRSRSAASSRSAVGSWTSTRRPRSELSAEHREEVDPGSFLAPLDLVPDEALVAIAATEEIPAALHDHWEDVTASILEEDARRLYVDVAEPLQA